MSELHELHDLFESGLKPGDLVEFFTRKGTRTRGQSYVKSIERNDDGSRSMKFDPWPVGARNSDTFKIVRKGKRQ